MVKWQYESSQFTTFLVSKAANLDYVMIVVNEFYIVLLVLVFFFFKIISSFTHQ